MIELNRILGPVDFSKESTLEARFAVTLAQEFKAKLYVLHVITPLPAYLEAEVLHSEEIKSQTTEKIDKELHEFIPKKIKEMIEVEEILEHGEPHNAIVEKAKELDADVIVIGTRGLSGLAHIMLGSVAERVIRHSPCPVFSILNPRDTIQYGLE